LALSAYYANINPFNNVALALQPGILASYVMKADLGSSAAPLRSWRRRPTVPQKTFQVADRLMDKGRSQLKFGDIMQSSSQYFQIPDAKGTGICQMTSQLSGSEPLGICERFSAWRWCTGLLIRMIGIRVFLRTTGNLPRLTLNLGLPMKSLPIQPSAQQPIDFDLTDLTCTELARTATERLGQQQSQQSPHIGSLRFGRQGQPDPRGYAFYFKSARVAMVWTTRTLRRSIDAVPAEINLDLFQRAPQR